MIYSQRSNREWRNAIFLRRSRWKFVLVIFKMKNHHSSIQGYKFFIKWFFFSFYQFHVIASTSQSFTVTSYSYIDRKCSDIFNTKILHTQKKITKRDFSFYLLAVCMIQEHDDMKNGRNELISTLVLHSITL